MIIGFDVGGTHADIVLVGDSGLEKWIKVPTDTSDLFKTVLTGIEKNNGKYSTRNDQTCGSFNNAYHQCDYPEYPS